MEPENVKPSICPDAIILYKSKAFAVANGKYDGVENVLLMRWNGGEESSMGYPKAFGNPMWFVVEDKLALGILTSLLSHKESDKQKVLDAIQKIINKETL